MYFYKFLATNNIWMHIQQIESSYDHTQKLMGPTPQYYRSWYFTSYCVLEVHNPAQELSWVKDPANTFDLNPKLEILLEILMDPIPFSKLTFESLFRAWGVESHTKHLSELKARPIHFLISNTFQSLIIQVPRSLLDVLNVTAVLSITPPQQPSPAIIPSADTVYILQFLG